MNAPLLAKDIMVTKLVTLSPHSDVFDAIGLLLKHRITGAPVVDDDHNFLGAFTDKSCMNVLTLMAQFADETGALKGKPPLARDFMVTNLVTLAPDTDVFEAIGHLLKHRISGAPVIDDQRNFLGVFSEKTSMSVLIAAAYEQLPTTEVAAFMNTDFGRMISPETDLLECAQIFVETPYRRLTVQSERKLIGQIGRREVLSNGNILLAAGRERQTASPAGSSPSDQDAGSLEAARAPLPSTEVRDFIHTSARTITEDLDLLGIAQIFLTTPYRRLPVLSGRKLIGQISRRDVLSATHSLMEVAPAREKALLYLSSLLERSDAPFA